MYIVYIQPPAKDKHAQKMSPSDNYAIYTTNNQPNNGWLNISVPSWGNAMYKYKYVIGLHILLDVPHSDTLEFTINDKLFVLLTRPVYRDIREYNF